DATMASFLSQGWLLSRRQVLRGAGVAMALPLLDCMRPLRALGAEQSLRPRRSAFIYMPNGVNTLDYQITESGANYEFSKSLKPLEKHRANITPISGLYHPNGLGQNHNCGRIWLTGGRWGQTRRNSISVDQLMTKVTAKHTRFTSMQLATQGGSLAWNVDGVHLPAESTPSVVFRELFEAPKGDSTAQRRALNRKGSILDAVLDEARALERQLGKEDRGRLEQFLTSAREVEIRTERADKWIDAPRPTVDDGTRSRLNRSVSQEMVGEYFRTMYDLIVLAFQTDMTRVAAFVTGRETSGLKIPEIGHNKDRHSLSHHNGNPKTMIGLTESDTFNVTQFAYLLDRLGEVEDADGPLLDTTMALFGSGMSYGHSHGNANLPLVLAGGSKLGLKHGRHVDFNAIGNSGSYRYQLDAPGKHYAICHKPVNSRAHMSNLLLTMAQKMGVETDKFSDSNSTLSEILT
ncbi:MAG: DUF1552 domain-containing protein, partial [Pirellulales bacterium]|nr:DUF1552 domain-containing protein [Pirellulales bacterium]